MAKIKANLSLDEDLYNRVRVALKAVDGSHISDWFNELMADSVDSLEMMATAKDPVKLAQKLKEGFMDKFESEMFKAADAIRTINEVAKGGKTAKLKRSTAKK